MSLKHKKTSASPLVLILSTVVIFASFAGFFLQENTIIATRLLQIRHQLSRQLNTMTAKVSPPRPIKLYSNNKFIPVCGAVNNRCPFAARSRLALAEANADYEEIEIDLQNKPDWYLKLNPNGKIPAMDFGGAFVIESNVIAEFVADLFPKAHLRPQGHSAEAALDSAKMRLFVEVWQSKVQGSIFAPFFGPGDKDAPTKIINGLKNDVVPLLKEHGGPYVLGKEFSMADVLTHSFVLRLFAFAKHGFYGDELYAQLKSIKEVNDWHEALLSRESVKKTWNEDDIVSGMKKFLESKNKK